MSGNYKKELNEAIALSRLAGAAMMHYYDIEYEKTEKDDAKSAAEAILTEVDLKLDKIIRTYLSEMWPEDALLTEETKASADWYKQRRVWIVDPLDGTLGFVKKTGSFGISIALIEDARPVVGVLFAPAAEQLAEAALGSGTRLNGKSVDLSNGPGLNKLIVSSNSFKKPAYVNAIKQLGSPGILTMESVVMKTIKVLSGEGELYPIAPLSDLEKSTPKFWDIAAADLLVNEAGGRGTDYTGELYHYNRENYNIDEGALFGTPAAHAYGLAHLK